MSKNLHLIDDSSSLQIIQPEQRIVLDSADSISILEVSKDQDLSYSKDESSLSFFIEEEKKSVLLESIKEHVPIQKVISNDPPKRVRKQIFEKYKPAPKKIQNEKKTEGYEYDIIKEFDKIFTKMETPKSNKNLEIQPNSQQSKEKKESTVRKNLFLKKEPKQFQASENKVYASSHIIAVNEDVLRNLNEFNQGQRVESGDKINLSQIGNRVSLIERQQSIELSKDSDQLAQILSSQIFHESDRQFQYFPIDKNNANQQASNNQIVNVQSKINIKVGVQDRNSENVQIGDINLAESKFVQKKQQTDQNLQQSRFSDVYQRIQLSQSTVNGEFISRKPERINIFTNNFLGNDVLESKLFKKSASNGFLAYQDQTIIHGLASQRIIEEASEDPRIPLFLRKAVKTNSIIPNFTDQRVRLNSGGENKKLQTLVQNFSDSLHFLQKILQSLKIEEINIDKIKEAFKHGMTVQKFCGLDWSTIKEQDVELLRPRHNFLAREWPVSKVYKALESYRKIIEGHKGIQINLNDQRGIKKYLEIREKYIQIQKNILLISEDIYTRIKCLQVPKHYNTVRQIIKSQEILLKRKEIEKIQRDLEQLQKLRLRNDELCRSEVGEHVIKKIENRIKFNLALY